LPDGTTVEIGGNIDRLDYDKEKNEYAIFDYKATEKSINNKITVGGEKEGYYNQIALYKYILIKGDFYIDGEYHKDPLNVVSTKFYITDRNTDTDKLVDLKLTREDCEDVKNKFANAIYEIKQHKFNSLCDSDEDTCSFCHNSKFCHFDKLKYIKGVNNEQRTNNKNS
jgi:ATP-dependent helicase/DNAse subunit B